MRTTVIIEKRGAGYVCTVSGKHGGGYQMARAGLDSQSAAALAAREMIRYAVSNDEGGDLMAPAEVLTLVPEHLHKIDDKSGL
jgi:hypothetical protein